MKVNGAQSSDVSNVVEILWFNEILSSQNIRSPVVS